MARTGRPKTELTLTEGEREQLVRWSRRAKSSQAFALRSRIVLACAEGADNKSVAARLNCAEATVGKCRLRFVASAQFIRAAPLFLSAPSAHASTILDRN